MFRVLHSFQPDIFLLEGLISSLIVYFFYCQSRSFDRERSSLNFPFFFFLFSFYKQTPRFVLFYYRMSRSAAKGGADTSPGFVRYTKGRAAWFILQNSWKWSAADEGMIWTLACVKPADMPLVCSRGKKFRRNWLLAWAPVQFARSFNDSIFSFDWNRARQLWI